MRLKVMRIDPVQFLVVPRYLAGIMMMPGAVYLCHVYRFIGWYIYCA